MAVGPEKAPWDGKKQETVEQAISLLSSVSNEGFHTRTIRELFNEVSKRQRPALWQHHPLDYSKENKEFLESGEYKRDEIRKLLNLFGPAIIGAARSLVISEKKDRIVRRGALIYISEALLMSVIEQGE